MASEAGAEGVLLADKPAGPTSHDVVDRVRRALATRRVGHAGTLDPFATGLLVLLVGRTTRLAEYVSGLDKTYLATVRLGAASSTDDREGEIRELPGGAIPVPEDALRKALAHFVGEQEQVPPSFSAKRLQGKRAHRMARGGTAFTLAPSRVRVHAIELLAYRHPLLRLRVVTGPGVYVRSLARDLGEALGCGAHLRELRREAVGGFESGQAAGWEVLSGAGARGRLLPPETAVAHLPVLILDADSARAVAQGRAVSLPETPAGPPGAVRLVGPRGFLGVGHRGPGGVRGVKVLYPDRGLP